MKKLLLFLLLIAGVNVSGQKLYEGILISENADTLFVYFTEKAPNQFFNSIIYKTEVDSPEKYLADVIQFKEIQFLESRKLFKRITLDQEKHFAQLLINGNIALFKLNNKREGYSYIIEKNDSIYQLVKEEYTQNNVVKYRNRYIGILNIAMADCNKIEAKDIAGTDYQDRDLVQLVKAYNKCMGDYSESLQYDYSSIEDEEFKTSRSQWMFNLGVLFPGAEATRLHSIVVDPELIFLIGKSSGVFKAGIGTGFWGVFGKSGSETWDVWGGSIDIKYNQKDLFLWPLSVHLRASLDNILVIGVGGGYLYSLNKYADNGWYVKPYIGGLLTSKVMFKLELLHMNLGDKVIPALGGGFAFCW